MNRINTEGKSWIMKFGLDLKWLDSYNWKIQQQKQTSRTVSVYSASSTIWSVATL